MFDAGVGRERRVHGRSVAYLERRRDRRDRCRVLADCVGDDPATVPPCCGRHTETCRGQDRLTVHDNQASGVGTELWRA